MISVSFQCHKNFQCDFQCKSCLGFYLCVLMFSIKNLIFLLKINISDGFRQFLVVPGVVGSMVFSGNEILYWA